MFRGRIFNAPVMYSQAQLDLMNEFRKLWSQHVYWTRMYIISNANELADLDFVTMRLLKNPKDFANVLKKYYGVDLANKFEKLFTEHLTIAAQLVNDAKAWNNSAVAETRKKWYKNADDIVKFMAGINPFWNENEWKNLFYKHLMLTENEAVEILTKKYEASIKTFDEIENEALMMTDEMSSGIIKQFRV